MERGETQISQRLILVATVGGSSTCHEVMISPSGNQNAPNGTQQPCWEQPFHSWDVERLMERGKRDSPRSARGQSEHSWTTGVCHGQGPVCVSSVQSSARWTMGTGCHWDFWEPWVVCHVAVVHLCHHSLRHWIPSVAVCLPCWLAGSSLTKILLVIHT